MVIQKLLVEEGIKRGLKESQKYSVSVLGYDFIGLVSRLAVFFVAAFLIIFVCSFCSKNCRLGGCSRPGNFSWRVRGVPGKA